jgi:hypothetical protein
MELLSIPDREAKTRRQLQLVDTALTKEFSMLAADVVHREVATVSDGLIANARFTDHVAVLTGRFAAEHLRAGLPAVEDPILRTDNRRHIARSHWWTRH